MANIRTVPADKYNLDLANALKEMPEFEKPEWIYFVKSGHGKMRPIQDDDFWYKRAASIMRQLYIRKIVGVSRLRTRYGGRKNNGMAPEHFAKASGKIIRVLLQQLEKAGFAEKAVGKKAGRQLTKAGIEFMEELVK